MEVDEVEQVEVVGGREGEMAMAMDIFSDESTDVEDGLSDEVVFSESKDISKERDKLRETDRDRIRDKERDRKRDKERDEVRDRERDEVRDKERDDIRDRERDNLAIRELTASRNEGGEPELTVKRVLEVFKRISSIRTPIINSQLALPFNKNPVKDSKKFKEEYAKVKHDIGKVDGKKGKAAYEEEKEKRKSLPFNWPESSPESTGTLI